MKYFTASVGTVFIESFPPDCIHLDFSAVKTRVGNFIIGASGSDKQMLCASSGTRAALNIAAEKSKKKEVGKPLVERFYFCGVVFLKKENYMLLSNLLTIFSPNR